MNYLIYLVIGLGFCASFVALAWTVGWALKKTTWVPSNCSPIESASLALAYLFVVGAVGSIAIGVGRLLLTMLGYH